MVMVMRRVRVMVVVVMMWDGGRNSWLWCPTTWTGRVAQTRCALVVLRFAYVMVMTVRKVSRHIQLCLMYVLWGCWMMVMVVWHR